MGKLTRTSLVLVLLSSLLSLSTATDTLTPDRPLALGETLVSASGIFALGFFTPSPTSENRYVGIWYNKIPVQTIVWVANRNNPITNSKASLLINSNGTLLITVNNFTVIWSSAATLSLPVSNPIAQILDTGNFVVRKAESGNSELCAWQSFDYPTDTMLPGMKGGWNLTSGLNRNITGWATLTDPTTGPHTLFIDLSGYPQLILTSGSTRTWRAGPWNGVRWSGIPDMKTYGTFTFDFVQNAEEVYYMYHIKDPTVISRVIVNPAGIVQRLVWLEQSQTWNQFWFAPKDQCDTVSPCGPFGVCDPNKSPICDCIQGFVPRNPANWAFRDGSNGCTRKTPLDCRIGTDGFVMVSEAKLPDTSSSTVDMSLSLDQCRDRCLENCSCTAYASAMNGTGCLIWTSNLTDIRVWSFDGQDLYVRLAIADLGSSDESHNSGMHTLEIAMPTVLGIIIFAWITYCCIQRKKRRITRSLVTSINNPYNYDATENNEMDLPLFDMSTIIVATHNFSPDNKLGEGGFGPVFKGSLEDGQEIAVKRLAKTSVQGIEQFKNEMVLIAKLQHRNLVRLLGCCIQGDERMLVYEYMPNKSLDAFLFDKARCQSLDWHIRYNVIMGTARGLLYLHQDSRFRIIHRDIKTSNILLDEDMNPKISDFGMARIFGGDDTQVNTRKVVGTYGYMSPEYAMDGIFSIKSDVFSFGVLVLEIISGKKNRGMYHTNPDMNLLGHAWSLWKEGKTLELVDDSLGYSYSCAETLRCVTVGLLCVQECPKDRPTMSSVVLMLGSMSMPLRKPKKPGFVTIRGPSETSSSTSKQPSPSINGMSLTALQGR